MVYLYVNYFFSLFVPTNYYIDLKGYLNKACMYKAISTSARIPLGYYLTHYMM